MRSNLAWAVMGALVATATGCSSDSDAKEESHDNIVADGGANALGEDEPGEVGDETVDLDEGAPIKASKLEWTYVELPGSKCRDGKTTGIGISINPASDKLIIFMEGGGACLETITCAGNPRSWGESSLGAGPMTSLLQRDEVNPYADWNMVYVPYCSGDVFTGTNESGYNGEPQTGYVNFTKTLERVVPTFKSKVDTVVLAGHSAGGFGVAWNWMRTQDAFGEIPVHAFDDSGQPLGPMYLTPCFQQYVAKQWGWKPTIHPACKDCNVDEGSVVRPLIEAALTRKTKGRYALLTNDEDGVIKTFFAYGLDNCTSLNGAIALPKAYPVGMFPDGLEELRERIKPFKNAAMYEIVGGGHVLTGSTNAWSTAVEDVTILQWTKWFLAGNSKWRSVGP